MLYVEDDLTVRENFTQIFQEYFDNVLTTDNGIDAIKIYDKNHVDVVILDISIPGINGLDVASKIRVVDKDVIILIVSAYSDRDKLLKAINLKLFGYLIKPITLKQIDESMKEIIASILNKSLVNLSSEFTWNMMQHHLFYQGKNVKLTQNETKIIQFLVKNKNNFLTLESLQDLLELKGSALESGFNNIVQMISRLKKKLSKIDNSEEFFIENHYGLGYKIIDYR